ncbi:MAG: hypothetical protein AAFY73_08060 [Pseudomonadota bacterium]
MPENQQIDDDYNEPERRNASFKQRLNNYGLAALLLFIILLEGLNNSLGWELMILKAAAVPLFMMSQGFLNAQYTSTRSKTPWTGPFVEKTVLYAVMFAAFIAIFTWSPDKTAMDMMWQIGLAIIGFAIVLPIALSLVSRFIGRPGAN